MNSYPAVARKYTPFSLESQGSAIDRHPVVWGLHNFCESYAGATGSKALSPGFIGTEQ
jgi:hypothetical protein